MMQRMIPKKIPNTDNKPISDKRIFIILITNIAVSEPAFIKNNGRIPKINKNAAEKIRILGYKFLGLEVCWLISTEIEFTELPHLGQNFALSSN